VFHKDDISDIDQQVSYPPHCEINYYEQNRDAADRASDFWRYGGEVYSGLPGLKDHPRIKYVDLKRIAPGRGKSKLKLDKMNSGLQAICVAFRLGASEVRLLGFDCLPGRWSDAEPYNHRGGVQNSVYSRYANDFAALARAGLPIVNVTNGTALDCFETVPLNEF